MTASCNKVSTVVTMIMVIKNVNNIFIRPTCEQMLNYQINIDKFVIHNYLCRKYFFKTISHYYIVAQSNLIIFRW